MIYQSLIINSILPTFLFCFHHYHALITKQVRQPWHASFLEAKKINKKRISEVIMEMEQDTTYDKPKIKIKYEEQDLDNTKKHTNDEKIREQLRRQFI